MKLVLGEMDIRIRIIGSWVPEIMKLTESFADKLIIVNNNQEILQHVSRYMDSGEAGARVLR